MSEQKRLVFRPGVCTMGVSQHSQATVLQITGCRLMWDLTVFTDMPSCAAISVGVWPFRRKLLICVMCSLYISVPFRSPRGVGGSKSLQLFDMATGGGNYAQKAEFKGGINPTIKLTRTLA